jgi:acetyl-CoA C-acetyltransferase
MVQIIRNQLGIEEDDPRPLTLTGGMPFFGGPWSNYSIHPVVTAVDLIRENPSLKIMVVANGGYNTKESIGIYGNSPPIKPWNSEEASTLQDEIFRGKHLKVVERANGTLTIEAYTIMYDKKGDPTMVIVLGHLEDGSRTLALLPQDSNILKALEQQELVGKTCDVFHDDKKGLNFINGEELLKYEKVIKKTRSN